MGFCREGGGGSVSFRLSNLAKAEKSFDVRENDKEVLLLIDPFDFAPAHTSHSGFMTNVW